MPSFLKAVPSQYRLTAAVFAVAAAFFVTTSILAVGASGKYDSPDETANAFFIQRFADGAPLRVPDALLSVSPAPHPRGIAVRDGSLIPGSFLGIILLYGTLARWLGSGVIPFLTPLAASGGLIVFFLFVRRIFSTRTAFLSMVLLALHPAYLLWTGRGLHHNVLFTVFLITGAYFFARSLRSPGAAPRLPRWARAFDAFLAGIAFGAALGVRSAEALWVAGALTLVFFFARQRVDWQWGSWLFLVGGFAALLPVFLKNAELYGQPLSFAYAQGEIATESLGTVAQGLVAKFTRLFFPFGLDVGTALRQAWSYAVPLWLPVTLSAVGFVSFLRAPKTPSQRLYGFLAAIVAVWLILFYGSWTFHDNPDPTAVTLGTSYTRYWLPLYVLWLPFAALFLERFITRPREETGRRAITSALSPLLTGAVAFGVVYGSIAVAFVDKEEGLLAVRQRTREYRQLAERAIVVTPPNAVIVTDRGDKAFFPERRVYVLFPEQKSWESLGRLLAVAPVYVHLPPGDSAERMERRWNLQGFTLLKPIPLTPRDQLFALRLKTSPTKEEPAP